MQEEKELYAAIDLGSNSFHLLIAEIIEDQLQVIDRHKDMVRMAEGLQKNDCISDEKVEQALESLEKIAQRIHHIPRSHVRVVGTNTLRKAKNSKKFLKKAIQILGKPIEIISGREEARILYLGVSHSLPSDQGKRLVIDIGGGSTELIIGEEFQSQLRESLHMGCVSYTRRFFKKGRITENNWKQAVISAQRQLQNIVQAYKKEGWNVAIGASGSMRATAEVLLQNQWCVYGIDKQGLEKLVHHILSYKHVDELQKLKGLSQQRLPVFVGGLSIIQALFQSLDLDLIEISTGALREGMVYDLSGRLHHDDIRERTINKLSTQFEIDEHQVQRVMQTAQDLVANSNLQLEDDQKNMLEWTIRLHELGLNISHSHFEQHAAYILTHADMPGFSRQEQLKLAVLIALQRRKVKNDWLDKLTDYQFKRILPLMIVLRLSVLLNRSRIEQKIEGLSMDFKFNEILMDFPDQWLENHPLTKADLDAEKRYLKNLKLYLNFD